MKQFLTIAVCVFVLAHSGRAQQPYYWQLNDENGLPSNSIYDLFEDSRGFLWMGTEAGLVRYDGFQFNSYAFEGQLSRAATNIMEDARGRIWWMNFRGQVFFLEDEEVNHLPDTLNRFQSQLYDHIFLPDGRLCLGYARELVIYNPDSKEVVRCEGTQRHFRSLVRTEADEIYCMFDRGVGILEGDSMRTLGGPHETIRPDNPQSETVIGLANGSLQYWQKATGLWYTVSARGLEHNPQLAMPAMGKALPLQMVNLASHGAWITSYGGVHQLGTGRSLLPSKSVSDAVVDREGNTWLSTLHSGIYVFPSIAVQHYSSDNSVLTDNRVSKLTVDPSGNVYAGLGNGTVVRMPKNGASAVHYQLGVDKVIEALSFHSERNQLMAYSVYLCLFDVDDPVPQFKWWSPAVKAIAPWQNGFLMGDRNAVRIRQIDGEPLDLAALRGLPTFASEDWFGGWMLRWRVRTNAILPLPEDTAIWCAMEDGLWLFKDDTLTRVGAADINPICIAHDANGTVWAGTVSNGLFAFKEGKMVRHLTTADGLPSNHIQALAIGAGKIWCGTDRGIAGALPDGSSVAVIDRLDGLPTNDIRDLVVVNDSLWVASAKGLTHFSPAIATQNEVAPTVRISGISIMGIDTLLLPQYALDHDQTNVAIRFNAPAYRHRGALTYRYRMEGLSDDWVETPAATPIARFPSLPPGTYRFEVVAVNEDNVEGTVAATIRIDVAAPFWQTWGFFALLGLGLVLSVSAIFALRIRIIQSRNRIERDRRTSELKALKAQMNPHFVFNALNSIQDFILQKDARQANMFLGKFADLMRMVLDFSNRSSISLEEELTSLRLYLELEAIRFEHLLSYRIEVPDNLPTDHIQLPTMLIQPYVENALKHGLLHKKTNRELEIRFELESADMLRCSVHDNGIGRAKAEALKQNRPRSHKSFATSATQERLSLLNHGRKRAILVEWIDHTDAEGTATGTTVLLRIPIAEIEP